MFDNIKSLTHEIDYDNIITNNRLKKMNFTYFSFTTIGIVTKLWTVKNNKGENLNELLDIFKTRWKGDKREATEG